MKTIAVRYLENYTGFFASLAEDANLGFPAPRSFRWERNGAVQPNTTERQFGYPNVSIAHLHREDEGEYVLLATNYRVDGTVLGRGVGRLHLEVHCEQFYTKVYNDLS